MEQPTAPPELSPPGAPGGHLRVVPWRDPVIDRIGYDPRSVYAERFWLGILGPSALWLMRNLVGSLETSPAGTDVDLYSTARQIGLGGRSGRHSPFRRAMGRIVMFELAHFDAERQLAVRRFVPPLPSRHLARLGAAVQERHRSWLRIEDDRDPSVSRARRRARRMAIALFSLGDDYATVELELLAWHLHPALACDAAGWARRLTDEPITTGRSPVTPPSLGGNAQFTQSS